MIVDSPVESEQHFSMNFRLFLSHYVERVDAVLEQEMICWMVMVQISTISFHFLYVKLPEREPFSMVIQNENILEYILFLYRYTKCDDTSNDWW